MPGWKKYKLESRWPGEISITLAMQMTPPLWQKVRGTEEPHDESEGRQWKSWLKAQHSENEDHGIWSHQFSSVQFSCSVMSDSLWPHESQYASLPCPSPVPGVYPNSYLSSQWCHPAISSSVIPFSSCPQSLPASGSSFPMSQLFAWSGQSTGVSASASVLPMNIQDWFALGVTVLIPLQSKQLSRVLFNTAVQKCQFFGTQLSSQSKSYIHTWPLDLVPSLHGK